jgi:glycosyltransferase involved in cell wall biosynthesis
MRWAIITGEYPPQPGGVSDYTWLVANGLAKMGDEVHVWAPAGKQTRNSKSLIREPDSPDSEFPVVHELPGNYGLRDLDLLDRDLRRLNKSFRLLVQYVPHAFGAKGMNVPFCWWLSRRPEPVWIMFHEIVFPLSLRQPLAHNVLGVVTRLMAELLSRTADRIFISIPAWEKFLPKRIRKSVTWLPVPSTITSAVSPERVADIRLRLAGQNAFLLGHFGTYTGHIASLLVATLPSILRKDPSRRAILLGRGSEEFANNLRETNADLRDQISAPGPMPADEIAAHLAACDCILQPYVDGVSSRRTSLLASLALGLPIVTNRGPLTDPVWLNSDAVILAPSSSPTDLLKVVEQVLTEPRAREDLGRRAARFYQDHFALTHTIRILRGEKSVFKLAS